MDDPILSALSRKRADIAGQINRLEAQVRQLTADLEAVDVTIRVFDPAADIGAVKARVYPRRSKASWHQITRWVLSALHAANGPMSGTDVQIFVMKARGSQSERCQACGEHQETHQLMSRLLAA